MRFGKCLAVMLLLGLSACAERVYTGVVVGGYYDASWYPAAPRVVPQRREVCGPLYTRSDGTWAKDCHFEYY